MSNGNTMADTRTVEAGKLIKLTKPQIRWLKSQGDCCQESLPMFQRILEKGAVEIIERNYGQSRVRFTLTDAGRAAIKAGASS